MLNGCIGFFDSGVGGLSIWREVVKFMPWENTIYVADQAYLPYGKRSRRFVQSRAIQITDYLARQGSDLIVIACNSATVSAIDLLRARFNLPFIGVEPAIKLAAKITKTKNVILLSTNLTSRSGRNKSLKITFTHGMTVHQIDAPEFVELVESGEFNTPNTDKVISSFFQKHKPNKADVLVLACTHYPFLKQKMNQYLQEKVMIIDPSLAVAKQVVKIRKSKKAKINIKQGKHFFYTTGDPNTFSDSILKLLGLRYMVEKVSL
jgi:glutamate racemase